MIDRYCCGKAMYQEISKDNYLVNICKICGKIEKIPLFKEKLQMLK
jgi:hypothetical protein